LTRLNLVEQVMNKFFSKAPAKQKSHEVSKEPHETHETTANGGGLIRSHSPKGETNETIHAETVEQAFEKPHPDECICDDCLPE
jgi:hypothetical protein